MSFNGHYPKSWPVVSFGSAVESTKLGLVRSTKEMGDDLPYPYLRMDAISSDGQLSLSPIRMTDASNEEVDEFTLEPNDFLFNTRNSRELVGKTAVFRAEGTYLFNNNLMRVRFKESVDPVFAKYLFYTQAIRSQLERIKSVQRLSLPSTTQIWRSSKSLSPRFPSKSGSRRFWTRPTPFAASGSKPSSSPSSFCGRRSWTCSAIR